MPITEQHRQADDGQLVRLTLRGDRTAFGHLYDRHVRRVRATLRSVAADPSAVDDLAQECFLRAYRKLDQLRPQENFGSWLLGIARYVGREQRRSLHRDRHRFVGAAPFSDKGRQAEAGPESCLEDLHDYLDVVLEQVHRLPESQRVAIQLFFLEECDAEKTAELLGMSRSGVYALLKRACRNVASSIDRGIPIKE